MQRARQKFGSSIGLAAAVVALACTMPTVRAQPPGAATRPRLATPPDETKLRAAGLRKLSGQHITLVTDLPSSPEIDALPEIFDQAYPQWCTYFGLDKEADVPWRVNAYLMGNKQRFRDSGLLPADLPEFLHGYSRGLDLWLNEQPSDYYRRHLLLHEGTHTFMNSLIGGCGPPWYMEGMAELLATHRYADGKLTLDVFPPHKKDVPYWGRVKLVQDAVAAGGALTVEDILHYGPTAHLKNEPYAFCWALCAMLDGNPRYRQRFREAAHDAPQRDFNERFRKRFDQDWDQLNLDWRAFEQAIDYGYDVDREGLVFAPAAVLPASGATVEVAADRGWQSTGFRLEAGKTYSLHASGRYQLADEPKIWWSESEGVSIRYHGGYPLGMLLAAVVPDKPAADQPGPFAQPQPVGALASLAPPVAGTLYLRINDAPAERKDNSGSLEVEIRQDAGGRRQ